MLFRIHLLAPMALLAFGGALLSSPVLSQRGGYVYRPPPPPPPPVHRPMPPRNYGNAYGSAGSRGMPAPRPRPYSAGSPAVREAFRGSGGAKPSLNSARKPTPGFGSTVQNRIGSGSRAAGGSAGLRDKFRGAAAGPSGGAPRSAASGSGFGSSVRNQVGSGTSASGGSSGLRDKFNAAAGGNGGKPPGGNTAASSGGGGTRPPGTSRLRDKFNAAAGSGAGRTDGRQVATPRARPSPRDAFGRAAMRAEREQGKLGADRRGAALHEKALRSRKPAPKPLPKPPFPAF